MNIIPAEYYTLIYYQILLIIVFLVFINSIINDIRDYALISFNKIFGYFFLFFVIFYMGLRPISGHYFGDMGYYYGFFKAINSGKDIIFSSDFLFTYFVKIALKFISPESIFFLIAILYVMPHYYFSKKFYASYWFYGFLMFVTSMSFWAYGTNGIRNGLATSIFIYAISHYNKKHIMYLIMGISIGIHNSLILPFLAFVLVDIIRLLNFKWNFYYLWLLSIPASLISGNFWGPFFSNFLTDKRSSNYLGGAAGVNIDIFSKTGFRWDFLLYSSVAVIFSYFFIYKIKIKDRFYSHIVNAYLICNAFWILVIKVPYSNRFAYLSWFLMAIVIIYPLLKYKILPNQNKFIGIIISMYFLFTLLIYLFR